MLLRWPLRLTGLLFLLATTYVIFLIYWLITFSLCIFSDILINKGCLIERLITLQVLLSVSVNRGMQFTKSMFEWYHSCHPCLNPHVSHWSELTVWSHLFLSIPLWLGSNIDYTWNLIMLDQKNLLYQSFDSIPW